MPGSSVLLRQGLSCLFQEEHHPPYSFTVTAVGNYQYHSLQLTSPNPHHTILLFTVPALLELLDLLYKDGTTSPFATHPKTMGLAVGCLLAYGIVYGAELNFSSTLYSPAIRHGMMLFGSMCVASLSSIFFRDSLQWVVYMLYTLLWTAKLLSSLSPLMLNKLPGQVKSLVRPTWDRCRELSVFYRHTFGLRGNILPL